jgi:hypothetical protein
MEGQFNSFPRPLQYNIKQLSSFSKTAVRLNPDRWDKVVANDTIRVDLPTNTLVDLRTLCMYCKGSGTTSAKQVHFPRLGLNSLIKTVSWFVNGTLIERIDNYNVLYNKLYDLDGGDGGQTVKRFLENADPSLTISTSTTVATGSGNPSITSKLATSTTDRKMAIFNWLGFASSCSTSILDTADLGRVSLEITFDSPNVMFQSTSITRITDHNYELNDIHFMINKITFNDPTYYQMKSAKLLSSGLTVAYQTYIASKGALVQKGTSVNVYTSINTTSLDQLIGTMTPEVNSTSNLLLYGNWDASSSATNAYEFNRIYNSGVTTADAGTDATIGGFYNQSRYFRSDAVGLTSATWEINSTPLHPQPLQDYEIFGENLIALGHNNLDMATSIHQGCNGLGAFLKYYFAIITSLELIQTDGFLKSGLNGLSSSLNIVLKMVFSSTDSSFVPYIFAKTTRILQINEGHSISVIV